MVVLITGPSGFIGGAIADRILGRAEVRGLTNHPRKNRFGDRVRTFPYAFDRPDGMADAFAGVDVFVNSYYVRFDYGGVTFEDAVERSRTLIAHAAAAGVRRIVHVSVSNASTASDLRYYANKARIEALVAGSGLDFTILRPALVVGDGDILVNNIAYFLRRLPLFTLFGDGSYRLQPIVLEAFAEIAAEAIDGAYRNEIVPVAGPTDWRFIDLLHAIRRAVGSRAAIVGAPRWAALAGLKVAGALLDDVVLTRDEIEGLTREYLYVPNPIRRGADFAEWVSDPRVASTLGRQYASELRRHFR